LLAAASPTQATNIDKIENALAVVVEKLRQLGLDIDIDKLELIHFTRKRADPALDLPIIVKLPNIPPRTIRPSMVMRWLGVFFDRKLTWKAHVEKMAMRARSTIAGLRILGNTVRGLHVANARLVYKAVVLPVLTFASLVWYKG
ncbi:hypothetical protein HDZ31DRAFT_18368, partial [Schizophyllum fasciatum]